jgi:hypothetical protein
MRVVQIAIPSSQLENFGRLESGNGATSQPSSQPVASRKERHPLTAGQYRWGYGGWESAYKYAQTVCVNLQIKHSQRIQVVLCF